jgi:hypothetical protein
MARFEIECKTGKKCVIEASQGYRDGDVYRLKGVEYNINCRGDIEIPAEKVKRFELTRSGDSPYE